MKNEHLSPDEALERLRKLVMTQDEHLESETEAAPKICDTCQFTAHRLGGIDTSVVFTYKASPYFSILRTSTTGLIKAVTHIGDYDTEEQAIAAVKVRIVNDPRSSFQVVKVTP